MTGKYLYALFSKYSEALGKGRFHEWEHNSDEFKAMHDAVAKSLNEQSSGFRELLKKYGKHHALCTTGQECTCGFETVEKMYLIQ